MATSAAFNLDHADGEAMHELVVDLLCNKVDKARLDVIAIQKAGRNIDQKLGIDYFLILRSGLVYSLQEKCLRAENAKFDTITIEHMSNRDTGKKGDWFNCKANLYLVTYGNPQTGILSAYILYKNAMMLAIENRPIYPMTGKPINGLGSDKSTFLAYPAKYFPANCFLYKQPPQGGNP